MTTWDPAQYERYKGYRDRPALDLMLRIPAGLSPRTIWDLGCGTGEHAALLAARHPGAEVHGLDSSPEMLAEARKRSVRVDWVQGDIAAFEPPTPPDLIFTNAALQWVPDHEQLLQQLASRLAPSGVFACQLPVPLEIGAHRALREVATDGPWADALAGVADARRQWPSEAYHDWLAPLTESDIWTTTYLHVLTGADAVVDWMLGAGLRPALEALAETPAQRDAFLAAYRARIEALYPRRKDGSVLLPFPRLFIVARRR